MEEPVGLAPEKTMPGAASWSSVVCGIAAWLGAYTPLAMIAAPIGITLGIVGLRSQPRWLAAIGLVLNVLAAAVTVLFIYSLWAGGELGFG